MKLCKEWKDGVKWKVISHNSDNSDKLFKLHLCIRLQNPRQRRRRVMSGALILMRRSLDIQN